MLGLPPMRNVRHRAKPADARVHRAFRVLDAQVGDSERYVDQSHAEIEGSLVLGIGSEDQSECRRGTATQPGDRLARRVESRLEMLDRNRTAVGILNVIFARPGDLHRCYHGSRRRARHPVTLSASLASRETIPATIDRRERDSQNLGRVNSGYERTDTGCSVEGWSFVQGHRGIPYPGRACLGYAFVVESCDRS